MITSFLKNIFLNNLSQGLQFGSRWLFTIFLIKLLPLDDFAIFSFVYSISNILIALFTFGNGVYLINEAGASLESKNKLAQSITLAFFLFFPIFLISLFLNFTTINSPEIPLLPYGIFLGLVFSINTCLFSFLKGLGNFLIEVKTYAISSICIAFFIVYLFYRTISLQSIFIILILINLLITVLVLYMTNVLSLNFILRNFRFKFIFNTLHKRIYFGLQEITTASYSQGGMIIIYYLVSASIYGQYRAMLVFISPFTLFNVAFSQVILNQLKQISLESAKKTLFKLQFPFLILLSIFLIGLYLWGAPIVKLITELDIKAGENNTSYVFALIIILSSFIYGGLEMLLVRLNMQKYRFYAMVVGAIVNLLSIFILLPKYGLVGAMTTNLLSYLSVLISILIIVRFVKK